MFSTLYKELSFDAKFMNWPPAGAALYKNTVFLKRDYRAR